MTSCLFIINLLSIYYDHGIVSLLALNFPVRAFGREIFVNMGYDLTPGNFIISFLITWAENRRIEFDFSWKDVSKACNDLLIPHNCMKEKVLNENTEMNTKSTTFM